MKTKTFVGASLMVFLSACANAEEKEFQWPEKEYESNQDILLLYSIFGPVENNKRCEAYYLAEFSSTVVVDEFIIHYEAMVQNYDRENTVTKLGDYEFKFYNMGGNTYKYQMSTAVLPCDTTLVKITNVETYVNGKKVEEPTMVVMQPYALVTE